MTKGELKNIVAEAIEVDPALLAENTLLDDFESYDSVNRLNLIVALDDGAGLRLGFTELEGLKTYSDIEALARAKGLELAD